MRVFKADLHIHSCLSPCGDLDMSPKGVVLKSLEKGLDLIAVCDHNSAENVGAVVRAGARRGLPVLAGMEVSSKEEVHTLAIFDTEEQAERLQGFVYRHLRGTNRPELFGDQVVANEYDEVEGFNDRRLIGATELELKDIVTEVHRLGGLCIPSHVDRPSFSILSQLGFIPPDLDLDALEVSRHVKRDEVPRKIPEAGNYPLVTFSDAHFLDDIGSAYTTFVMDGPRVDEIRMAFENKSGRRIED